MFVKAFVHGSTYISANNQYTMTSHHTATLLCRREFRLVYWYGDLHHANAETTEEASN